MPWPKSKALQKSSLWKSMSCMRCSGETEERSSKRARVDSSQHMLTMASHPEDAVAEAAKATDGETRCQGHCCRTDTADLLPLELYSPGEQTVWSSAAPEESADESKHLPEVVLYHIFSYLSAEDLCCMKRVCTFWCEMAEKDSLWRALVQRKWRLELEAVLPPMSKSWQGEYRRLWYCVPSQLSEIIQEHTDEVLHISFSHNGRYFSTTSRDCTVKVWALGRPTRLLQSYDLHLNPRWEYTHSSYFNASDSLLMVHILSHSPRPEAYLAVLALLPDRLALTAMVPVDVAAWASDSAFIGATWELVNNNLQLQVKSFEVGVDDRLELIEDMAKKNLRKLEDIQHIKRQLLFTLPRNFDVMGNMAVIPDPSVTTHAGTMALSPSSSGKGPQGSSVGAVGGGRPELESSREHHQHQQLSTLLSGQRLVALGSQLRNTLHLLSLDTKQHLTDPTEEGAGGEGEEAGEGEVPRVERLPGLVNRVLSVQGRISGMCYSPDRRFLFINCRPWTQAPSQHHPNPDLSPNLEVRTIDLKSFRETGVRFTGHQGFHPYMFCTIEPDASRDFVASGSTNSQGLVWDQHHRCSVAQLSHSQGVLNTVAFHPHNQECCISVGDDYCIKVWVSRRLISELSKRPSESSEILRGLQE